MHIGTETDTPTEDAGITVIREEAAPPRTAPTQPTPATAPIAAPPQQNRPVLTQVPISQLVCSADPLRATQAEDERALAGLKASILEYGLIVSLYVRQMPKQQPLEPARYEVLEGRRRVAAVRSLQREGKLADTFTLPISYALEKAGAPTRDPDLLVSEISFNANWHRLELPPSGVAAMIQGMLSKGISQREVAQRMGVSEAFVSERMSIRRSACVDVVEALDRKEIPIHVAYSLAQKDHTEQKKELAKIQRAVEKAESLEEEDNGAEAPEKDPSEKKARRPSQKKLEAMQRHILNECPNAIHAKGVYAGIQYALGRMTLQELQMTMKSYERFEDTPTEAAMAGVPSSGAEGAATSDAADEGPPASFDDVEV